MDVGAGGPEPVGRPVELRSRQPRTTAARRPHLARRSSGSELDDIDRARARSPADDDLFGRRPRWDVARHTSAGTDPSATSSSTHGLAVFGPHEDAMLAAEWKLAHSVLSSSMNLGLLHPSEVVEAAESRLPRGEAPTELGRGLHPTGDRLARVRVGCLLVVDARLPRRATRSRADAPGPPAFTGAGAHRDGLRRQRDRPRPRSRVRASHRTADGARQPGAHGRRRPEGDDRRGCGRASSTVPTG